MQNNKQSPIYTLFESAMKSVLESFDKALNSMKAGLLGCLTAPFVFVWDVIMLLWHLTWKVVWLAIGAGCVLSAPLVVLIAALILGTGWVSIPFTIVAMIFAIPVAALIWITLFLFKKVVDALTTGEVEKKRNADKKAKRTRTLWILIGILAAMFLCLPLGILILIGWGIYAGVKAIRNRRATKNVRQAS